VEYRESHLRRQRRMFLRSDRQRKSGEFFAGLIVCSFPPMGATDPEKSREIHEEKLKFPPAAQEVTTKFSRFRPFPPRVNW